MPDRPSGKCPRKYCYRCAASELALGTNAPAVRFDQMAHDCKSKSGTAGIPGARPVDSVEALEDARQMLGRDADACVANRDARPPVGLSPRVSHPQPLTHPLAVLPEGPAAAVVRNAR